MINVNYGVKGLFGLTVRRDKYEVWQIAAGEVAVAPCLELTFCLASMNQRKQAGKT